MTAGWCVRVSVFDDVVVSISERELAGRELSEADANLIRDCAQHLLSFVGPKKPTICACPGYEGVKAHIRAVSAVTAATGFRASAAKKSSR